MRLDTSVLRYLTRDDFRVLTAIEMGLKNHEYVPVQLIETISNLRRGGCHKVLSLLLKHKLVAHNGKRYDGYKLTYNGYDFLALKAFLSRGMIDDVQMTRIGVGKEADVHVCYDKDGKKLALKLHRLGRISFRSIKNNRDYLQHRKHASWMYLSRLAATKEYAYAKALSDAGFRVPRAIDHNRHAILMEFVDAFPLYQMRILSRPERIMASLFRLLLRLAKSGLIHGDFNEFNLLIDTDERITLIDFPQIVTMEHPNAKFYFERDVNCVLRFFRKRFSLETDEYPSYEEAAAAYRELNPAEEEEVDDVPKDKIGASMVMVAGADTAITRRAVTSLESRNHDDEDDSEDATGESSNSRSSGHSLASSAGRKGPKRIALGAGALLESEDMLLLHTIHEGQTGEGAEEEDGDSDDEEQGSDVENGGHEVVDRDIMTPCADDHGSSSASDVDSDEDRPTRRRDDDSDGDEDGDIDPLTARLQAHLNLSRGGAPSEDDSSGSGDSSDEDGEAEEGRKKASGGVPKIEDQIHVLQRKKTTRKILTAEEIRNKLKNKEKQTRFKNCNKNKTQRKMKNEAADACRDGGGGW